MSAICVISWKTNREVRMKMAECTLFVSRKHYQVFCFVISLTFFY